MKDNITEQLVLEYLNSDTPENRKTEIKEKLKELNYNLRELEDLIDLERTMDSITFDGPSEKLDVNFFNMLEEEKSKRKESLFAKILSLLTENNVGPKLAYGFSLLTIGWFLGTQYSGSSSDSKLDSLHIKINSMKEVMMLSMLNQQSPMERIKAVNFTSEMNSVDEKVVTALLNVLNHDENVNVRLITVEALTKFVDQPKVRSGLILSIANQESPIVQLALADLMGKIQEKKSISEFEKLLAKKDLRFSVREKIEDTIKML